MNLAQQLIGIAIMSVIIAGLALIWAWGENRRAKEKNTKPYSSTCGAGCKGCMGASSCKSAQRQAEIEKKEE